jgi:hypothetical protein
VFDFTEVSGSDDLYYLTIVLALHVGDALAQCRQ